MSAAIPVYGVWRRNQGLEKLFVEESDAYDYARRNTRPEAECWVHEHVLHGKSEVADG